MKPDNIPTAPPLDTIIRLTTVADAYAAGQATGTALRDRLGPGNLALELPAGQDPRAQALSLEIDQSVRMVLDRHAALTEQHEAQTAAAEDAKQRATKRLKESETALEKAETELAAFLNSFPPPGGTR